jgi:hypothetical protein
MESKLPGLIKARNEAYELRDWVLKKYPDEQYRKDNVIVSAALRQCEVNIDRLEHKIEVEVLMHILTAS